MTMKKFFKEASVYTGIIISIASLDGYRRTVLNDMNKEKLNNIREGMVDLKNRSKEFEIKNKEYLDQLEFSNLKISKVNGDIIENFKNMKHTSELLKTKLEHLNNEDLSSDVKETMTNEISKMIEELGVKTNSQTELINKATNALDEYIKSTFSGGSSSKFFDDFWDKLNNFISNATAEQLGAVGHISMSFVVLLCLSSLVTVFYGDTLILKFKLEERFPRLAKFIQLRRKFQQYYFFWNVFIIVFILFFVIYINICVLYYKL
jgi:hypothetical protein